MSDGEEGSTVETGRGPIEYLEAGEGVPVLFIHGSPGGSDQGMLMGCFLVDAGFRVVAPSRPGYLGTPLPGGTASPQATADLLLALMDVLSIERFGIVCWSGGGPSSYRLAASQPERVSALVACAAVSGPYEFAKGLAGAETRLMTSGIGGWLLRQIAARSPKSVVKSTLKEEGQLSKPDAAALFEHVWAQPDKREFVLRLSGTLSGRNLGLKNDQLRFPQLGDLGLNEISVPTLLIHGTADSDVGPEQSEHALSAIAGAEILRVEKGTHLCVWTDPTSADIQSSIVMHLRA